MKNILVIAVIAITFLSGCTTSTPITKSIAYKGIYEEKPLTVLLMPPINRSTNVEAKEFFHSTLNIPIANAGFYVIPTFISMETLRKESAYDSELFLNSPLTKFGEVFGADLAVFTIIHKWDKSGLAARVNVKVEYIIKSVKTNEVVFTRTGEVAYNTSVSTGFGTLANMVASAINTAATKYVDVARTCNSYTFKDLPAGKYSPNYDADGEQIAGKKDFRVTLNSQYR